MYGLFDIAQLIRSHKERERVEFQKKNFQPIVFTSPIINVLKSERPFDLSM